MTLAKWTMRESQQQIGAELRIRGRKLTEAQYAAVVQSTQTAPGRALVNRIAAAVTQRLSSTARPAKFPETLNGWIGLWIEALAEVDGHGSGQVIESLSLVCAARRKLPERVLWEILRTSEGALTWLHKSFPFLPRPKEMPRTTFSRLMAGLQDVLEATTVDGDVSYELAHRGMSDALTRALPPASMQAAHRSLSQSYLAAVADGPYPNATPHLLSETLYQQIKIGKEAVPIIEQLVARVEFIAAKSAPACLDDLIEEVTLLRVAGWLDLEVLREYCSLLVQERTGLQELPDFAERCVFIHQAIDAMLRSNPLRKAALLAAGDAFGALVRQRFAMPRLPGIARIDARKSGPYQVMLPFGDEVAIGQEDASIAIVGGIYGEQRRRLLGHPRGPRSGAALGARKLAKNCLLTWGADGQVALSSLRAGRDILRMSARSAHGLECADQMADGRFVASSHGANRIFRWDASGAPDGEINILAGEAASLTIGNQGLKPGIPIRRDVYLPMLPRAFNDLTPAFRSFLVPLGRERIVTSGMCALAVWSFAKGGPELFISQIFDQTWSPKFGIPADGDLIIVCNNGGVVRLLVDERRIELIQPAGEDRGGADPLDQTRLFCWALREDGIIQATILDRTNGAVLSTHELKNDGGADMEYFRGGMSNVPRGLPSAARPSDRVVRLRLGIDRSRERDDNSDEFLVVRPVRNLGGKGFRTVIPAREDGPTGGLYAGPKWSARPDQFGRENGEHQRSR